MINFHFPTGTVEAIDALASALNSPSVLLGHEIAYVLGQMQNPYILPTLRKVLESADYHPIVRHEAAEAIGALNDKESLALIESYCDHEMSEIADTCQLARDRIKFVEANPEFYKTYKSLYDCVDPAPPMEEDDIETLKTTLNDHSLSLFIRYRAMFKLRDINSAEACLALASSLHDKSPVFRHEIAYVYGQMQNNASIPALRMLMEKLDEHPMVRHEAAEALGSIACADEDVALLEHFKKDSDRIVAESCEVALDIHDYWTTDEVETAIVEEASN